MIRLLNHRQLHIVEEKGKFHIEDGVSKKLVYLEKSNREELTAFIHGIGYSWPNPPFAPHSGECGPRYYDIDIDGFICGQCGEEMPSATAVVGGLDG